jgi:hypothetical protein
LNQITALSAKIWRASKLGQKEHAEVDRALAGGFRHAPRAIERVELPTQAGAVEQRSRQAQR